MAKTNVVLTIPEPRRIELVERPYPKISAGYAIIRTEIAPICLEGSRIWSNHDFESWGLLNRSTRVQTSARASASSYFRVIIADNVTAAETPFLPPTV